MENPEDLVATLEGQVERLKVIFSETKEQLTDDVSEVSQFCITLECILRHQQKEKVSFWGERRDYWHYLSEAVGRMRTLEGIVKQVQLLPQLLTGQGRGRALIRQCLSTHLLADCLQNSLAKTKRTKEWYHVGALLLSPTHSQRVISSLYDLSEVNFDLPSEGLDLDETWPSFVLKSFQNSENRKSLLTTLTMATKEAKVADQKKPPQRSLLEHAVEEEPSEIFVKREIPFDMELVGELLKDIQSNLIGQEDDHIHTHTHGNLPELRVSKLDDITSCLTVLRDYITSWSHDVLKHQSTLRPELKRLRERVADLELQLQETMFESESSEGDLLSQLQNSRDELKLCTEQLNRLSEENTDLRAQLSESRQKVVELETLNFSLEEELLDGEKEEEAHDDIPQPSSQEITDLTAQIHSKNEEIESLQSQLIDLSSHVHSQNADNDSLRSQLADDHRVLQELQNYCSSLQHQAVSGCQTNAVLAAKLKGLSLLEAKLESETQTRVRLEQERDMAREELHSMHGLVENETQSLRFKLSSQSMELQLSKQSISEKDQALSSQRSKVTQLEQALEETEGRYSVAEQQIEELRQELQDVESILQDSRVEMTSLHEQLTEKTLSRDQERAELLRLQNEVDTLQTRLCLEKQELSRQVQKLSDENNDIRRAFKKLLQQKVTLWQHADELEQEQVAMGIWIDSSTILECMGCGDTFSMFNRKHHCRSCGKVYCSSCCDKKAKLPVSKDPVRVCTKCDEKIVQLRTPFAAKLINQDCENGLTTPIDDQSGEEVIEGHPLRTSSNSLNIERNIELNGNSLQAKLLLQNSDMISSLEGSTTTEHSHLTTDTADKIDEETSATHYTTAPTSLNHAAFDNESLQSCNSTEYGLDPQLKAKADQPEIGFQISTIEGVTADDSYYLIETKPKGSEFPIGLDSPGSLQLDVDALASKLASLEPANLELSQHSKMTLTHTMEASMGGSENLTFQEVKLGGGEAHRVPVQVDKMGTVVAWEFTTEPKGLAFGLAYQKELKSPEEEVLPLRRCVSHKTTLTGEYVVQKAGIYILRFDNCHSKYSGRKLLYKIWMKHPM